MTLGYNVTLRNAQLNAITSAAGASAVITIYEGTRPATGASDSGSTVLAELTCGSTFAAAASAGVLTLNAITGDSSANADGTAQWFRLETSGGTHVMDGSVTATGGGGDMTLNSTSLTEGATVAISSFTVTAGNA